MRIVGIFPDQDQVGGVVDSLKNLGLDRKDMIISDLAEEPITEKQRLKDDIMVQSERDSIRFGERGPFAKGVQQAVYLAFRHQLFYLPLPYVPPLLVPVSNPPL